MRLRSYVPPLGFHALTPFYESILRASLRDGACLGRLVSNAGLEAGMRVLDLGCGTGRLTRTAAAGNDAAFVAIDPDRAALRLARRRSLPGRRRVWLCRGEGERLPFADETFDRVLSSLVFHHLTQESKRRAFQEVSRVLRPGGELHLADFGRPASALMALCSWSVAAIDGLERTGGNFRGELPRFMAEAGFAEVAERARYATVCGSLTLLSGVKGAP